ncbi:SGNH/GDSL hydrolase family protein [Pseudarthrobacter oxydans]|uniref:SGNH/GDSL hydrolase family protein n=1 Tax=Pseudarthrobacter oxydans TaxID=1671 RepID=UPI003ECE436D
MAAAVGLVTGCASDSPPVSDQVQKSLPGGTKQTSPTATTKTVAPVRIGIFGDSISEANSPDFNSGRFGSTSWVSHIGEGFAFAGGWAESGARTANMLDRAAPVSADVLVVIAGTNDYAGGVPFSDTADNLDGIVARAGVHRVIISSVPPNDIDPEAATDFNEQLAAHAQARGWVLVDAMAGLRSGDRFARGMTSDGIHPTEEGAKTVATAIAEAIKLNAQG